MKELELYISTPIFNKNRDVLNLLSILKKYYPDYNHKGLTHNTIANGLSENSNIKKLRYVMTDLTKLVEQFIAFKNYQENSGLHLIKAYQKRGLNKFFLQELNKKHAELENSNIRDEIHYKTIHELNEVSFQHSQQTDNRNIDTKLQELVDNLDYHYLSKKLKYSSEIINRMNILNVKYDIKLLENLLEYLDKNPLTNKASILVYQLVLQTLQEPEKEENYKKLKKKIDTYLESFEKEEQYDLFGYLQNYCIKQINTGKNDYLLELFSNYSDMINTKVVIKNNEIAQFDFKNIVTVALRVEKYKWTENFIEKFQHYLSGVHRTNAYTYNKARLDYYQKNYRNCLKQLLTVEFTDIYYGLDSRSLLLKTYFELEDYESAISLINAFKIYLKRDKKISEYQKTTYLNFLKISNLLIRFKLGYLKDSEKIFNTLDSTKQVADLTWLRQKAKALN